MIEIPCAITDPLGLHVQLAVLRASEAKRWRSRTTLEYHGNVIPAADLMQVMMYGIRSGEHVVVRVEGPDEVTAAEALRKIMATF